MRVIICGECFSPNLGDGVIAEALASCIKRIGSEHDVRFLDISGREDFVTSASSLGRHGKKGVVRNLHQMLFRNSYYYAAVTSWMRYGGDRRGDLAPEGDLNPAGIIIGGGQMLQDNRLAFPVAISSIVRAAAHMEIPVSLFSVGVGERWSSVGRRLMGEALEADVIRSIYCRDAHSAARLRRLFPTVSAKVLETYDAALMHEPDRKYPDGPERAIGLCVMHPSTIRWTKSRHPLQDKAKAAEFWLRLFRVLKEAGYAPRIFTNGAPDDADFAVHVAGCIEQSCNAPRSEVLEPRPTRPNELEALIHNYRAIVAFRLHANIVATVAGVPCVALGWDDKVMQFMRYSNQERWFLGENFLVEEVAASAMKAVEVGAREVPLDAIRADILNKLTDVLNDFEGRQLIALRCGSD